jgi:hypothetical protein
MIGTIRRPPAVAHAWRRGRSFLETISKVGVVDIGRRRSSARDGAGHDRRGQGNGATFVLANAPSHSSGFVLVDGKAGNKALQRSSGAGASLWPRGDVLCLNFMVAWGVKESNTFNPFTVGNADAIGEMPSRQLRKNEDGSQRADQRHARSRNT